MTKSELTNDELIVIETLRAFPEFGYILEDILKMDENHHSELERK